MPLAPRLPFTPPKAVQVSDSLAILDDGERIVFFNAGGPIFSCSNDDRTGIRVGIVTVIEQGLAGLVAVARALGLHRSTVHRDLGLFREHGIEGLIAKQPGPKAPHKLTPEVCERVQGILDRGETIRAAAAAVGVSDRGVRHAIARGLLKAPKQTRPVRSATQTESDLSGPRERADEDQSCDGGVAVKRTTERILARQGLLVEAPPEFESSESVGGAGVLLAVPALLEQGLIDIGVDVYKALRNGFFGLRSVLLMFAFMALLRIRSPEQLTEHAPGELGLILGLDRAPEVKTLRRKLRELGERKLAHTLAQRLTQHWAASAPRELAILYADGHVRPYHGRKHSLPKQHVQQRGRPMPGTKDFHLNDRRAEPLLCVTAEANEGLLAMLESELLPRVREVVGSRRRVTVVFDREGWSPALFAKWKDEGFDILTYRKGKQTRWQEQSFDDVEGTVGGKRVGFRLAERSVKLSNGLLVREVRRLTEDGHQTAVITTNETLSTLAVAHWMFARWRQENYFRYMRHEFALDHLCTYDVDPADPSRLVTSPKRADLLKKLAAARSLRTKLIERRVRLEPGSRARVGQEMVSEEELDRLILDQDRVIAKLEKSVKAIPEKVRLDTVLSPKEIVQVERERKIIVDAIKMIAYRAESSLVRLIEPLFARHEDEARKLLKSIFQATADLIADEGRGVLIVRFHGLANPRATRALAQLCTIISEYDATYPGTDLRLRFEAPMSQ